MPYHRPEDIEAKEVVPGFFGKFYHSDNTTCAHWVVESDASLPEHSHPHEQVINMIEGQFELTVDGTSHILTAGDVFVIPSDVPHSGRSLTDCKIIDVFYPVRKNYR